MKRRPDFPKLAVAFVLVLPACVATLPNGTLVPQELCSLLPAHDGRPAIMVSGMHSGMPDVDEDAVWACVDARCELILSAHSLGAVDAAWIDPYTLQIETTAYGIRYFDRFLRNALFSPAPARDATPRVGLISDATDTSVSAVTGACPTAEGHSFIARKSF